MLAPSVSICSPVGALARELEIALTKDLDRTQISDPVAIEDVYSQFDVRFQNRPDYRIWRKAMEPYFAHRRPWLANIDTPCSMGWGSRAELMRDCLASTDPIVIWSAIGLAPELTRNASTAPDDPIWEFVAEIRQRIFMRLEPLPSCPASCGLAAAMFLVRYQNLFFRAKTPLSLDESAELLHEITHWLRIADIGWEPGEKLDVNRAIEERRGNDRLRAGHPAMEHGNLSGMFSVLRAMLSPKITQLNDKTIALGELIRKYARTAWLTARSKRLAELEYQATLENADDVRAASNRRKAFLEELDALFHYTNAARDAGEYLEAAKHLYLIFRIIPDEFVNDHEVQAELKRRSLIFRYIREVGLEIDPRFAIEGRPPRPVTERSTPHQTTQAPAGLYFLRVGAEQATDRRWQQILEEAPKGEGETPPGYLLTTMRRMADENPPTYASPRALRAAFELALKYGYVRSAGKILARAIYHDEFNLTPAAILDFVHHVRRCLQLDPFGMRQEKIVEWYDYIRDACTNLYFSSKTSRKWFAAEDKLWIHETILGRTHTHHRSVDIENAARMYQKAEGSYEEDSLRDFYTWDYDFARKPYGVVNASTLASFCARYEASPLGAPVMISIMCMGKVVSIVGVGKDGMAHGSEIVVPDIAAAIRDLTQESEFWFKSRSLPFDKQISWPPPLRQIARGIREMMARCDSTSKVVILAADSLTELPWQHLLLSTPAPTPGGSSNDPGILVSLVPNLGMISMPARNGHTVQNGVRAFVSVEDDPAIRALAQTVRETVGRVTPAVATSICVLAGHGRPTTTSTRPTIDFGDGNRIETLDQWIDILPYRHFLVHSCHGGRVEPGFMREMGGIPGLALSLGVDTFVAPVAEVNARAASTLQLIAFSKTRTAPFGENYMRAIRHDGEVSLYNIYGNPFESFFREADSPHAARQVQTL